MARSPDYIAQAADRVMIMDLLARYAWEIDHGSPEGWADVFTADGVFEGPIPGCGRRADRRGSSMPPHSAKDC